MFRSQYGNEGRFAVSNWILALIITLLQAGTGRGLTEFQVLSVVKEFADSYLAPRNVEVARSINSTLFAEYVRGTADLSTNFDGRELSTEYLFGLFVNTAEDQSDPSPFGSPISYNVTALLVQHNMISTSIKFEFEYPILTRTFPIQIDAFFEVNEDREISQYDVSFRRWGWATDHIIPMLIPYMAVGLNITNTTDPSTILRRYLSSKICQTAIKYCQGSDEQYASWNQCMEFLNEKEVGQWYRMGEDNLVCRHLHVPMLSLRPSVHCPHVGPSGGDMCISRNYTEVVLEDHFGHGWLAPKFVTPENQEEVGGIYAVSGQGLDPLLEISLSANDMHSWDPTLYATALLGYFLVFYVVSNILWFIYFRHCRIFPTLGLEHQKNVVMYTMNIIFTTIALALELVATPAFAGSYALWEVQSLRTAGVLVSGLYIFELIYRLKMRVPMIIHHFLTIFAISFTVTVFEYTQSMTYLISAVIWLFQATTEQPTFLGLVGYRLDWNPKTVARILKLASFQTFIIKSASAIGIMVYWGIHQNYAYRPMDIAWTSLMFIIAIGLLLTQIWGSWVTYSIGHRLLTEPVLTQTRFKGFNLSVYNIIRLKPESKPKVSRSDATSSADVEVGGDDHDGRGQDRAGSGSSCEIGFGLGSGPGAPETTPATPSTASQLLAVPLSQNDPERRMGSGSTIAIDALKDTNAENGASGAGVMLGGDREEQGESGFPPWATASGTWSRASNEHIQQQTLPKSPELNNLITQQSNHFASSSSFGPALGNSPTSPAAGLSTEPSAHGVGHPQLTASTNDSAERQHPLEANGGGPEAFSDFLNHAWNIPLPDSVDSHSYSHIGSPSSPTVPGGRWPVPGTRSRSSDHSGGPPEHMKSHKELEMDMKSGGSRVIRAQDEDHLCGSRRANAYEEPGTAL